MWTDPVAWIVNIVDILSVGVLARRDRVGSTVLMREERKTHAECPREKQQNISRCGKRRAIVEFLQACVWFVNGLRSLAGLGDSREVDTRMP